MSVGAWTFQPRTFIPVGGVDPYATYLLFSTTFSGSLSHSTPLPVLPAHLCLRHLSLCWVLGWAVAQVKGVVELDWSRQLRFCVPDKTQYSCVLLCWLVLGPSCLACKPCLVLHATRVVLLFDVHACTGVAHGVAVWVFTSLGMLASAQAASTHGSCLSTQLTYHSHSLAECAATVLHALLLALARRHAVWPL